VRVDGALGLAVGEAALQDLPARRVERHREGTAAERGCLVPRLVRVPGDGGEL